MWLKLLTWLPFMGRLSGLKRLLPGKGSGLVMLVLIGCLVGGWFWHQTVVRALEAEVSAKAADLAAVTQSRDDWKSTAEQRADDLRQAEARRQQSEAAVRALQKRLAGIDRDYDTVKTTIRAAPATDDGPVAPVLRNTLEALP